MVRRSVLTSVLLVSGAIPALADGNAAWLQQQGVANSALIEQGPGSGNRAGRSTDGNLNDFEAVAQYDAQNVLAIRQSGNANRTGTDLGGHNGWAMQNGARNRMDVTQSGDGNEVRTLRQFSLKLDELDPAISVTNRLEVVQSTDQNLIVEILQQQSEQRHEPNDMRIRQQGGNGNAVMLARQLQGDDNRMDLLQDGTGNYLLEARQEGSGNRLTAAFLGNDNGLNGLGFGTQAALAAGAIQGALLQDGDDNGIDLLITGHGNLFGIRQIGSGNIAAPITVTGSDNALAIFQSGVGNRVENSLVHGDQNDIGIAQFGTDNVATLTVTGNGNAVWFDQDGTDNSATAQITGNLNTATLTQIGASNSAIFSVTGNGNLIDGFQSGTSNLAFVTQAGHLNVTTFSQIGGFNVVTVNQ